MNDTHSILYSIRDSLLRIEAMLAEEIQRKKAPRKKGNRTAARDRALCEQGRAANVDAIGIDLILQYWRKICPNHPQPLRLTDQRKLELEAFRRRMDGDLEAVQGVFESVAASRFLSHPPKGFVTLFWTIAEKNLTELMEGKYA